MTFGSEAVTSKSKRDGQEIHAKAVEARTVLPFRTEVAGRHARVVMWPAAGRRRELGERGK